MRKENRFVKFASKFAVPTLIMLIVVSIGTIFALYSSQQLAATHFPGPFATLFDYSLYPSSEHPAYALGQILNNIIAYFFILSGVVIFILALVLVKHNVDLKIKAAILALFLAVPATIGMTAGFIDFCGHGFKVLTSAKSYGFAIISFGMILTYALDFLYYIFTIIYLVYAITTAVKVNKGELPVNETERVVTGEEEPAIEEEPRADEDEEEKRAALLKDIRRIVREELDRLDRVAIITEEVAEPAPAPAPAVEETKAVVEEPVEEEPEEEPVEEAEEVEEPVEEENTAGGFASISAVRIPFAQKIVKADKELRDKYNELKNEFLAYGASSRLSISADTFRLHRKAYVKITLVGKTLKVYFALDPKDFEESPIPVTDAGDKTAYADVPALLRVKSNLSVRRAKDLAALAFAKDNIEKEQEAANHDYVKDIRAELKAQKEAQK